MADLFGMEARIGAVAQATIVLAGQTAGLLSLRPDPAFLATLTAPVAVAIRVDQTDDDGATFYSLGGCMSDHVVNDCSGVDGLGQPVDAIGFSWAEQVVRDDVLAHYGWTTKRAIPTDTSQLYYQLALLGTARVTVDAFTYAWVVDGLQVASYDEMVLLVASTRKQGKTPIVTTKRLADAELKYGLTFGTGDVLPSPVLSGRHSASLVGTFSVNAATTAAVTSSSRTTTTGNTIVASDGNFRATTAETSHAFTDSKGNTPYTDVEQQSGAGGDQHRTVGGYFVAIAGGASHTVTGTMTGGAGTISHALNAGEYDGIKVSPTISTGSNKGSGTTWTSSITPSVTSLVVVSVNVANSFFSGLAVTDGTQAVQTSINNDGNITQAYKVGQAGGAACTIAGTLGSSVAYGWAMIAIEEAAAGTTVTDWMNSNRIDVPTQHTKLTLIPSGPMPGRGI